MTADQQTWLSTWLSPGYCRLLPMPRGHWHGLPVALRCPPPFLPPLSGRQFVLAARKLGPRPSAITSTSTANARIAHAMATPVCRCVTRLWSSFHVLTLYRSRRSSGITPGGSTPRTRRPVWRGLTLRSGRRLSNPPPSSLESFSLSIDTFGGRTAMVAMRRLPRICLPPSGSPTKLPCNRFVPILPVYREFTNFG